MTYEELLAYLKLVPEAVQDPAFYSIVATGLDPQQAAAQNISGQNQLLQTGAGALGGLASIGNTFGNAVDPLARAAENYFGPITLGGLFPTVGQARQTRDEGASNYNALYGGSIPAAVGKNILQDAVIGPVARAGGAAVGAVAPSVAAGFNKLIGSGRLGQVGGGAAAGSANALLGTGLFASDSEQPFVDQLLQNAVFGAGFGGLGGVAGNQGPLRAAGNDTPPPVARAVGPGYYGLEDAVLKAEGAPKAATADKWLQWVNGAQARGQLSKEERADIGLDDWLEEKAATGEKVTREDIQQFVTENAPQLKVVTPGGGVDEHALQNAIEEMATADALSLVDEEGIDFDDAYDQVMAVNEGYYRDEATGLIESKNAGLPRYAGYQWDKNNVRDYHERLVVLASPLNTVEGKVQRAKELGFQPVKGAGETYYIKDPSKPASHSVGRVGARSPDEALELWARTSAKPEDLKLPSPYQSVHWDEPNVLAHWRANVRDTLVDDGVPSYHIEEVQSDWHQQGRTAEQESASKGENRPGYRDKASESQRKKLQAERDKIASDPAYATGVENDLVLKVRELDQKIRGLTGQYPDAPFKRSWEQLTFKSALKEAVDRGLTRVSWTPGQLQSTATGQEKNTRGNDERYNKRLVNIANDLGKKYGTKVQLQPMAPNVKATTQYDPFSGAASKEAIFEVGPAYKDGKLIGYTANLNSIASKDAKNLYEALLKEMAGKPEASKIYTLSPTQEEAEQSITEIIDKYRPKIPYMNLTPRMVEDVKNGKLKLY